VKIILDLCGGTGAWSKPYRDAGYLVEVVTLPEKDVRFYEFPKTPVHGILAAPPCTVFCIANNRNWRIDAKLLEGLSVLDACLRIIKMTKPMWWALENPHGRLQRWLGLPQFKFNPCDFGDPYTKKTQIWGNFIPPVKRNKVEPKLKKYVDNVKGSRKAGGRMEVRSITPPGFAKAFFEANP